MSEHLVLGQKGEKLAVAHLKKKGFKLLDKNVRTPFGEIDLIFLDKPVVVFVEVKARSSAGFGGPLGAISRHKRFKVSQSSLHYLKEKGWQDKPARFDVVGIVFAGEKPDIDHVVDAFDLEIP